MITAKRIFWLVAVLAAASLVTLMTLRQRESPVVTPPSPAPARGGDAKAASPTDASETSSPIPPAEAPVAPAPEPAAAAIPRAPRLPLAPGVIPIRNEKTIDFSNGRPVVRNEAADKAALEAGLREIEEATADLAPAPKANPAPDK